MTVQCDTGQFKKKVTLSHVYNEVTSEPIITFVQTNFESFPNNCCISRDCRLTGYFTINR
jgi:hypothetical protein